MSFNIGDYVSDDHVESIGEIAKSQSAIIQALSLDNSQKDKEIEKLNNNTNELEKWLIEWREMLDCPDFYEEGIIDCINNTLTKLQELKEGIKNE